MILGDVVAVILPRPDVGEIVFLIEPLIGGPEAAFVPLREFLNDVLLQRDHIQVVGPRPGYYGTLIELGLILGLGREEGVVDVVLLLVLRIVQSVALPRRRRSCSGCTGRGRCCGFPWSGTSPENSRNTGTPAASFWA